MPTPTYDAIASTTLTSSASSVTFSSIVGTYRDLVLVINAAQTTSGGYPYMGINGGGVGNINLVQMKGNGSTAASASASNEEWFNFDFMDSGMMTTSFEFSSIVHFFDYAQTDKHKSFLARTDNASVRTIATAGRKAITTAITSLTVYPGAGNLAAGSTFSLYGIVA